MFIRRVNKDKKKNEVGYTEIGRGSGSRRLTESKATTSPRNGEKKKIKGKVRVKKKKKKRREGEGGEKK